MMQHAATATKLTSVSSASPALRAALAAEGLPTDDLTEDGRIFFEMKFDDNACGFGGLELYGTDALLRSVVIGREQQGRGYGASLTKGLLREALDRGVRRVFLLTDKADHYFVRHGFKTIGRSDAPEAILSTRQASSLCPSSATLMVWAVPLTED